MPVVWRAIYSVNSKDARGMHSVKTAEVDISATECPVGLIKPKSTQLISIIHDARDARDMAPEPFGPASEWDGQFYDAMVVLERQRMVAEDAIQRANYS